MSNDIPLKNVKGSITLGCIAITNEVDYNVRTTLRTIAMQNGSYVIVSFILVFPSFHE